MKKHGFGRRLAVVPGLGFVVPFATAAPAAAACARYGSPAGSVGQPAGSGPPVAETPVHRVGTPDAVPRAGPRTVPLRVTRE
ncbi:hypothetical protein [Streptomyces sp. Wb2n-11]|uniref:hypothetical protein n=1 Tax=Streptomyces sp. Wb2n-11 TaxID=1030533 RepID=UPI000A9EE68A|nr:hypothetical protein [Streptomyces sp. Wb2n-11]